MAATRLINVDEIVTTSGMVINLVNMTRTTFNPSATSSSQTRLINVDEFVTTGGMVINLVNMTVTPL